MIRICKSIGVEYNGFRYEIFEEKNQKEEIKKIYRINPKLFKLIETYFNGRNFFLNFDYFITTLSIGAIYGVYNFGD